jgi:hypothetical protein
MKEMIAIQRKYSRPTRLSDPHDDNCPESLRDLLATADSDLKWYDFRTLLGPHVPAGTYEEVVYFLPLAFRYIREHPDDALDLCTSIIWFCSEYAQRLHADGFLESARAAISDLLRHWASTFEVVYFDEAACRAKGWGIKHCDYVKGSESLYQSLEDLVEYRTNADLSETFLANLASFENDSTRAAWLLDAVRSRDDAYGPPDIGVFSCCANDRELLQRALDTALRDPQIRRVSPTYWEDTCRTLKLVSLGKHRGGS